MNRGRIALARPLEGLQVPATVHAVLAARIDRLPPEDKRLLQTAAVIGTEVPFAQALQALAHLPEDGDTRVLAIEICLALGGTLQPLLEHGRCCALLGEAEALARALDDRARLGRVLTQMAIVSWMMGNHDGAIAANQQALALAGELSDSALQMEVAFNLGLIYHAIGDFGRAAELLRRNVEAADQASGTPRTDWRIRSQAWLAWTLSVLGAFAEGRRQQARTALITAIDLYRAMEMTFWLPQAEAALAQVA